MPRRSIGRFWLEVAGIFAVTFAILELLSRLVLGRPEDILFNPQYDAISAPHQLVVQSTEGYSRGVTNELGNLDVQMPSSLPPNGVLVIGDSLTEARQVPQTKRFTNLAADLTDRHFYNVGHSGWSLLNAIAYLKTELHRFMPSTVVVQISGNDLDDMTAGAVHLVLRGEEFSVAMPQRKKTGVSRYITALRNTVFQSAFAASMTAASLKLLRGKSVETIGSCNTPAALTLAALPWVLQQLRAQHPDVRLLYIPSLEYVDTCRDRCLQAASAFKQAAEDANVPWIDPTSALCAKFASTRQPLNGFFNTIPGVGHLNVDGHAVVARVLALELEATGQ